MTLTLTETIKALKIHVVKIYLHQRSDPSIMSAPNFDVMSLGIYARTVGVMLKGVSVSLRMEQTKLKG